MDRFSFYMPVRIYFGKGEFEKCAGKIADISRNTLILTGKDSALKNGTADRLKSFLKEKNVDSIIVSGISTNPEREKINMISKEVKNQVDSVVALGGGSVIDAAKAIAVLSCSDSEDIWDFVMHNRKKPKKILSAAPVIAIPTIASTGSETNGLAVISSEKAKAKLEFFSEHVFPKIAIIDPLLTETVPENIKIYGAFDIFCHAMEAYLSSSMKKAPIDDGFAETVMKSVVLSVKNRSMIDSETLSWAASLPLTGITSTLRTGPFPLHMMEHVLSSFTGIHHGTGLFLLFPFYIEKIRKEREMRFKMFCRNVLSADCESATEIITDIFRYDLSDIRTLISRIDVPLFAEMTISVYGNRFGNIGLECFDYQGVYDVFEKLKTRACI